MPTSGPSTVLSIRVPKDLDRRVGHVARQRKCPKSAVIREALLLAFGEGPPAADPASEARRQSLLVSGRASERDALAFIDHAADQKGWR